MTKPKARKKPSVSIVGAGRLGTALALALAKAGYQIQALVSRRLSRARKAATLLGRPVFALSARRLDQIPPTNLIIIATPDDDIEGVAQALAALKIPPSGLRTVLHTSGALSAEVLDPIAKTGISTGSLHPLIAVSDSRSGAAELRGAFYCIEGHKLASQIARSIVFDLKGQSFSIESRDKSLYHASAVMASGHVVALFDVAVRLLVRSGLAENRARRVLIPLLQSTVQNLAVAPPGRALTGTFRRGDFATVKRHMAALKEISEPEVLAIYSLLGKLSLRLAGEEGLDPETRKAIERLLDKTD
ncbi:MAG TPA: Rossmann-like and DUF2520 domain-containing protein [Pyrinomonadaceae bacterium]|nr:Rossmann-like and DUF2520 domain-containing protein [Pyrinomonadaceae bacterium]